MARKFHRSHICRNKRGFSLIELSIAAAVIGVLATFAVGYYNSYVDDAKIATRNVNMQSINEALGNFKKDNNQYPRYLELEEVMQAYLNRNISVMLKEACEIDGCQVKYYLSRNPKRGEVGTTIGSGRIYAEKWADEINDLDLIEEYAVEKIEVLQR